MQNIPSPLSLGSTLPLIETCKGKKRLKGERIMQKHTKKKERKKKDKNKNLGLPPKPLFF